MRILREILLAFKVRFILLVLVGNILLAAVPALLWNAYAHHTLAPHPGTQVNGDTLSLMMDRDPQALGSLEPLQQFLSFEGLQVLGDFFRNGTIPSSIAVTVVLYLIFWALILGGILGHWQRGTRLNLKDFGCDCMRLFPSYFLIFLLRLFLLILLYQIVLIRGGELISNLFDPAPTEFLYLIFHWIPVILFLLLMLWLKIILDFARVAIASPDSHGFWVSAVDGIATSFRRFPSALLYLATILFLVTGLHILWSLSRELLEMTGFGFAGQEVFMILRIWMTLAWWKGLTFLRSLDELSL